MFNKIFSHDEISARAYEADQMAAAGYPDEAKMIRRKVVDLSPLFNKSVSMVSDAIASLLRSDLPAALAYEASQIADAGYLPETCNDEKATGLFENVTAWIMVPAHRTAAPCMANTVTP